MQALLVTWNAECCNAVNYSALSPGWYICGENNSGATETSEAVTPTPSSVRSFNIVERSEQYEAASLPLVDFIKFLQGSFAEAAASQIQSVGTEPFLWVFLTNNLAEIQTIDQP